MGLLHLVGAREDQQSQQQVASIGVHGEPEKAIEEARGPASLYPGACVYVQVEMVLDDRAEINRGGAVPFLVFAVLLILMVVAVLGLAYYLLSRWW